MKHVVFYRGIVVEAAELAATIQRLRESGIDADGDASTLDLRPHLDALLADPSRWSRESDLGVVKGGVEYVCGDEGGASYYACDPGRNAGKAGLVIKLQAPLERCFVDCRDFLCTVFQLWDQRAHLSADHIRATLVRLFGDASAQYFDRAAASKDQQTRIAMCNAAADDPRVVAAHYENRTCIGGRHGTRFCSAFVLRTPVPAVDILDLYPGNPSTVGTPEVTLNSLLGR